LTQYIVATQSVDFTKQPVFQPIKIEKHKQHLTQSVDFTKQPVFQPIKIEKHKQHLKKNKFSHSYKHCNKIES